MLLIANENPYVSGEVAMFEELIRAGEEKSSFTLPFGLRNFLISCLIEHQHDPDIVHCVLALDFLQSSLTSGAERAVVLKRAGDASLILAGFFPERALRLNVSSFYFRLMGQSFYGSLAAHLESGPSPEIGKFYNTVADVFPALELVLRNARGKAQDEWSAFRRFRAQLN